MQKKVIIGILVVMAVLLTIGLFPVHGEAKIYDSVVRLHVLANSDSDADQARKLKVRDAILTVTAPLLDDCPTGRLPKHCSGSTRETSSPPRMGR